MVELDGVEMRIDLFLRAVADLRVIGFGREMRGRANADIASGGGKGL